MSLLGERHREEGRFGDGVGGEIGRGNPRSGDERWAPLEEEQGRGSRGGAAPAPEAEEILPVVEGVVEVLVGDCAPALAPLGDAGAGTPPALAHTEPQLGVVGAEEAQSLGGAGQGGDLGRAQEREDADLNVLREIGEGRNTCVACVIRHW